MKQRFLTLAAPVMGLMMSVSAFGAISIISSAGGVRSNILTSGGGPDYATALSGALTSVALAPQHPAWSTTFQSTAPANWISFTSAHSPTTGSSGVPGDPIQNGNWVDFFHVFSSAENDVLQLEVMADDRADIYLIDLGPPVVVSSLLGSLDLPGSTCNSAPPSCTSPLQANIFTSINKNTTYALGFRVFQEAGTGFGLAYSGAVVPEPGFYGILSLGLGGLLVAVQRRRKNAKN